MTTQDLYDILDRISERDFASFSEKFCTYFGYPEWPGVIQPAEFDIAEKLLFTHRFNLPPCLQCGAKTLEESRSLCTRLQSCHGDHLWKD